MKVKIQQRSVYHKIAEVEIDVPKDIRKEDMHEYLIEHEDLYVDKIDEAMSETSLGYGHGMEDGMTDWKEESEWRYEIVDKNYGGHL